jgi:hypothetical protein
MCASAVRSSIHLRLVASGTHLIALRCLVGVERLLELTPLHLRDDLDEHGHDDTGPERPSERVE